MLLLNCARFFHILKASEPRKNASSITGRKQASPLILGPERKDDADYLDTCRSKRNIVEYDYIGAVTEQDAAELIEFTKELKNTVYAWLKQHHPELGF